MGELSVYWEVGVGAREISSAGKEHLLCKLEDQSLDPHLPRLNWPWPYMPLIPELVGVLSRNAEAFWLPVYSKNSGGAGL